MTDPTSDIFGCAFQVRTKERLLRDPLHGLIEFDENSPQDRLLVRLIDSAEMQRLRRIRQLGLAHYAFQGAEHSRFSHSVGACHLARRIIDRLSRMYAIDSELAFYTAAAALLHDLGHGPFSHVFERVAGRRHEDWTIRILHDPSTEVHRALSEYSRKLPSIVESILIGLAKPGYLASLVSGQLDADRLDYLQRDSLMTGVKYGVFDLDRLVHMLRISPEGEKIILDRGGIAPIEKYLHARAHMHRQVYLHKTVAAAEAMLTSLFRRARDLMRQGGEAGVERDAPLGRALAEPEELTVAEFLELDDVVAWSQIKRWTRSDDSVLSDLADRMLRRRLFKTIEVEADADLTAALERARGVVAAAGLDPNYYLIEFESSDTPYAPYDPTSNRTADRIFIETGRGGVIDVADASATIAAMARERPRLRRVVFPEAGPTGDIRSTLEPVFSRSS